ncbi:Fic family protein [Leucobacter ruminantium]|uniref:Fic family protein n=1 Tax=Leucobacter ruminantium TaxID=1289170 RepID=A0A939RUP7_9MICO|nr:Fic family protein [Leucobacter ruminantium]MBO1806015.1 Fic family protein [Leucobacter ruminantium]
MWQPDRPFNELPDPPIDQLETKAVLKATIEARTALASLDQAIRRIPNPAVLVSALPLLEAKASSEIENIVTTTDELFRLASDTEEQASPETKETLRYRFALFAGLRSLQNRPLTSSTAMEVCSRIKAREMRVRDLSGTYIGNPATKIARYTPPEGRSIIEQKLSSWEKFIHGNPDLDPLVIMAAAHYQFEAIHPFADGNGRTGRILNILLLTERGLLREPVLYLSRHIIRNKDEYYERLLSVTRDDDWEGWLLFMLEGVRSTSFETLRIIDEIQSLQLTMREELRDTTSAGANADLLDLLFEQPYCRISIVMERCGVSRPTASKWLRELGDAGKLRDLRVGRERLFINHRFLEVLSA